MFKRIPISAIAFDAGTQVREALDPDHVASIAEAMTEGAEIPPIVLFHDGSRYYIGDGFHRYMAAKRNDWREIDAEVHAGTRADALWFGLGANRKNGKNMTPADKRHAILLALKEWPDRSQTQIAEQIGCAVSYVTRIRAEVFTSEDLPSRVTGKDGKAYPAQRVKPKTEAAPGGAEPPPQELNPPPAGSKYEAIASMLKAGKPHKVIARELHVDNKRVGRIARELGIIRQTAPKPPAPTPEPKTNRNGSADRSRAAVQERTERIRELAAEGYNVPQIAAHVGIGENHCRKVINQEGIDVPAQRVMGKVHRHDSNRIVEQMLADAENLTADVPLIDLTSLDRERLPGWIAGFEGARNALGAFIRKLRLESQKDVEAV